MDQPVVILIYVLLALVIVLPIVGRILKRKARRAGAEHAAAKAAAKKGQQASGDGLGATLTLATDDSTARAIVGPIIEAGKRVRRLDDGTWAQTHYNDDDIVYGLAPVADGSRVSITRAIEFAGTLNGMKAWAKLREQIAGAAAAQGISTAEGVRPLVRTAETGPSGAVIWRPQA
jgi:hypothetical protein